MVELDLSAHVILLHLSALLVSTFSYQRSFHVGKMWLSVLLLIFIHAYTFHIRGTHKLCVHSTSAKMTSLWSISPTSLQMNGEKKNLCTSLIRFYQNKFPKVTRKERKKQINTKYAGHCTKVRSYILTAWPQGSPSTPDVTRRLMTGSCRHLSVMIPLLARWRDIRQVSICHHACPRMKLGEGQACPKIEVSLNQR